MHMISVFFLCPIMKSDHIHSHILIDASNKGRVKNFKLVEYNIACLGLEVFCDILEPIFCTAGQKE